MFKFMKSKKGFSLVELMIVVVIMAILVAVAVPIFNSVTGNSRAKTCIDNQRSIVSTLNTALLEKNVTTTTAQTFYVGNDGTNKGYYTSATVNQNTNVATCTGEIADDALFTETELTKLFQAPPYCPVKGSAIKVEIKGTTSTAGDTAIANITTTCMTNGSADTDPHALS